MDGGQYDLFENLKILRTGKFHWFLELVLNFSSGARLMNLYVALI
jgi:hypothetical protein